MKHGLKRILAGLLLVLGAVFVHGQTIPLSQSLNNLGNSSSLTGTESVVVVQGSVGKKAAFSQFENPLEALLELSDLQGSVTDAQVPNNITIDLATLATNVADGDKGDISISGGSWAIDAGVVTFAKIQNIATARLLGRSTAGSGSVEEISIGSGLSLSGGTLSVGDLSGTYQPLDADLTAIAALSGTNTLYYRSAADTWTAVTIGSGLNFSGGTLSATGGGGSSIVLDLADDGSNESSGVTEIAVTGDTNSIFTEPSADKLLIAVGNAWPVATQAQTGDSATGFFSAGQIERARGGTGADTSAYGAGLLGSDGSNNTIDVDTLAELETAIGSAGLATDAEVASTYATQATTITVAGTSNEIDSSAGAQSLAANRTWTLSLPATIDLGGKTSFEIPNAAAPTVDAFGEIAGDNNLWASGRGAIIAYDGTAATALVGVLVSDTPANGQVPKWNTGGTITWEDDSGGGGGDSISVEGSPVTDPNFDDGGDINFTNTSNTITADVKANSVALGTDTTGNYAAGDAEAGAALTGDSATAFFSSGTIEHERGGLEADVSAYAGFIAINSGATSNRTMAEGLAIDITNPAGAAGNPTFAFDPTELTGSRTFSDASTNTIVWTIDRQTGTDPTITFNSGSIGLQALTLGTPLAAADGGTGLTSLGTGVATWLGTPSSANFAAAVTGETGTGGVVFDTSPTITTPTISGSLTLNNGIVYADAAMGALAVDVTELNNTKTISTDSTLTFSGTPAAAGQIFGLQLTNSDTAAHTITIPSSKSEALGGAARTTFTIAAGQIVTIKWRYEGSSTYTMWGDPVRILDLTSATVAGADSFEFYDVTDGLSKRGLITDLESPLEAVMDLQDLQGAVTDAQVPNNITVDLATLASTVTVVDSTDATSFVAIFDSATGSLPVKTDGALLYNASNGTLTATTFSGAGGGLTLDASGFNGNLTTSDDTLQEVAQKVDDLSTGGTTNWNDIGDATADGTIALGGHETDWTSSIDAAGEAAWTLTMTDADVANDTSAFDIKFNDGADANAFYLRMIGDADGTPTSDFLFSQSGATFTLPLSLGTSGVFTTGTIELGAASDTTLARSSAGNVSIEGNVIYRAGGTDVAVADGGTGISSGTSGGVPYFSGSTTIASSAALTANALMIGGGAGAAPSTTTTGTGVLTALGNNANATGGFTTTDGTATLSGKTLTTPRFADAGYIADSNGNETLMFRLSSSAVNYLSILNAGTGNSPRFTAEGDDSGISLEFLVKGGGAYNFLATTTGPSDVRLFEDNDNGINFGKFTVQSSMTGDRTYTFPDSNTTIPIFSQTVTFAGPSAARTYTFPDANATMARTDAGQTFTGVQAFTGPTVGNGATGPGYIDFLEDTDNGSNRVRLLGQSSTGDIDVTLPATADTLIGKATTDTLTNKSYDAAGTGNTLKFKSFPQFTSPLRVEGTNATIGTTATAVGYGLVTFSNSTDQASNWAEWRILVPADWDTSVDPRVKVVDLIGADTAARRYVFSVASVAASASGTTSPGTAINVDFSGDGSGASGDVEISSTTTLTGWGAAATPGQMMIIRVARDGDQATQDASTVNSTLVAFELEYGASQ